MSNHHGHSHSHTGNKKALLISFLIITGYMIVEAIGGLLTNSLALLSDAGHMLSDSISLGIGLLAFTFGEKVANYSKTYGYKRLEILAAFFNGLALIVIAVFIIYDKNWQIFQLAGNCVNRYVCNRDYWFIRQYSCCLDYDAPR